MSAGGCVSPIPCVLIVRPMTVLSLLFAKHIMEKAGPEGVVEKTWVSSVYKCVCVVWDCVRCK